MMPYMYDSLYLLFMIPGLVLGFLTSLYVKSTFNRFSQVASRRGLTGAAAAEAMLRSAGIYDVRIEHISGFLSDHYDPSSKTLRLSDSVYGSYSLSAVGVACHEAGHALQHATGYTWLGLRSALVPIVNLGNKLWFYVCLLGYIIQSLAVVKFGVLVFGAAALFSIVTLPVEWNASARAKRVMVSAGILDRDEEASAGSVLNAAFLTYVAGAISSLMTLLYFLVRSGLLGGGRRRN